MPMDDTCPVPDCEHTDLNYNITVNNSRFQDADSVGVNETDLTFDLDMQGMEVRTIYVCNECGQNQRHLR